MSANTPPPPPPVPPVPPSPGTPEPAAPNEGSTGAGTTPPPPYAPAAGATSAPDASAPPPYSATPAAAPSAATPGRGMAIAALILGILAALGFAIPVLNIVSLIMAIIGLVLAIVAMRKYVTGKGLPIAGIIVNAFAAVLSVLFIALYAIGFAAFFQAASTAPPAPAPVTSGEPAPGDDGRSEGDDDVIIEEDEPGALDTTIELPAAGPGSLADPLPIGASVIVTENGFDAWEVTLDAVSLDATAAVLDAEPFNDPPPAGFQYGVVTLTMTNLSEFEIDPWFAIEVGYESSAGTFHSQFDASVTDPAPSLYDVGDLAPGATDTANVAVLIPSDAPASGAWIIYSFYDSTGAAFVAQ